MNFDLTKYLAHKKHTNLIFTACDDKYAFCLYISLSTLQENSPRLAQSADIYVAGYGLSDKSKEILNSFQAVRRLRKYPNVNFTLARRALQEVALHLQNCSLYPRLKYQFLCKLAGCVEDKNLPKLAWWIR